MRFCRSAILASLTSRGACTKGAAGIALAGVCGFLPPVSHIIRTITSARLMSSQDWTFFGSRPGGLGALSCTCWCMARSLLGGTLPRERQFLFADGQVAAVHNLGNDVDTVLELEVDQVWFSVRPFIQGGFFPCCEIDVGEGIIVIDRGNEKRFMRGLRVQEVVKLEFRRVTRAEVIDLLARLSLRGTNLVGGRARQ